MNQRTKKTDQNSRLLALGAQLREARETQEYSVAEVAERLYLSSSQVNAIEDAHYNLLPAEVFVKGYLRAYAKLLDIDPEVIVSQYQPPQPVAAVTPNPVREPEARPGLVARLPDTSTTLVLAAVAALVLMLLVSIIYFATATDSMPDEEVPAEAVEQASEQSSLLPASAGELFSEGENRLPGDGAITPESSLEMQFSDDCWVEIRDASRKVLLADMRRAGDTEIVEGEPPYKVVLGTSQAVAVRYQGRFVPVVPEAGKRSAQLVIGG